MTTPPQPTHNLRVLFCSDHPDALSGYSVETKLTALHIKEHCHLALLATFGLHGSIQDWHGIPLFPGGADAFSNDVIAKAARMWQADVVITLKDVMVFNPQSFQGFRWCVPGHTMVTLADGTHQSIRSIVDERLPVKVKAWDGKNTVDADILDYQCIPAAASGEIIEIETETTKILSVTAENQVLILRNGVIDWIDAGSIVHGDVVYCNSSIPYEKGSNDGSSKGNISQGHRSDERISAAVNGSRMGLYRRDFGRRGEYINYTGDEARALGASTTDQCNEYERGAIGMAGNEDRYAYKQSPSSTSTPDRPMAEMLYSFDTRIPWVSYSQELTAVSDNQAGTGTNCDAVHGEQSASAVQRPIHTERDRFVAPGAGFEPETVRRVRRRNRPFPFVYDITTTAGNFVAGGILIHNCPMSPIDHDPASPEVIERCRASYRPIAYAPQGFRALRRAGLDPLYAPHAYDPAVYHPMDRTEARKLFNIPDDLFVVGTVAVNRGGQPSRKCWNENLEAFALFAKDKPNVRYFLHTDVADDRYEAGIPLRRKIARLGIADKVLFCDQDRYRYGSGFPPEYMRAFYNSLDVLNAVSMGEGFGIPTLEAQACGTSVIVGDWCAHEDLCWGGWKVLKSETHVFDDMQQDGGVFIPQPAAIADRLQEAYGSLYYVDPGARGYWRGHYGERALAGAAPYQIETVVRDHWLPLLAELERDIKTPRSRGVLRIIRREEVFPHAA